MEEVDRLEDAPVVDELVGLLGAKVVAVVGGVGTTRLVGEWRRDERSPSRPGELRTALKITRALVRAEGQAVARRWWQGTNRFFRYRSPLEVIHEGEPENRAPLVRAALAFIYQ
jgi:hypothetical protein